MPRRPDLIKTGRLTDTFKVESYLFFSRAPSPRASRIHTPSHMPARARAEKERKRNNASCTWRAIVIGVNEGLGSKCSLVHSRRTGRPLIVSAATMVLASTNGSGCFGKGCDRDETRNLETVQRQRQRKKKKKKKTL